VLLTVTNAWAVSSSLWESHSKEDFEAGEPDGVSIMPSGQVVLGPEMRLVQLDALFAWTLASDSAGTVYAGTGNDGKIFKVNANGNAEVFAELELQQVFALAADGADTLYASGFPGGAIYSINREGEVSEYFDTEQDSVWALQMDANGVLFAATGDEGKIFQIEAEATGNLFYDSPERRILSLLCGPDGNVYAGSEGNGIVYRIDSQGNPFVLYDTELEEITSMAFDGTGNLYVVSSPGDLFAKIPPQVVHAAPRAARNQGGGGNQAEAQPGPGPGMPAIPTPKKRTCIIYEISQGGSATKFWSSPETLVFAIAFDGTNILAGSGDDGELYLVAPDAEFGIFYKADQKQILDVYRTSNGRTVSSTGNGATIVFFEKTYASEGIFFSQVHDATTVSQWGRIFWEADVPRQTKLLFSTRSGNSETPDDTWSDWSPERDSRDGFVTESPDARYIQWRVRLKTSNSGKTPVLRKVTVGYLQNNLPPRVEEVKVETGSESNKGGPQTQNASKNMGGAPAQAKAGPRASKEGVKPAVKEHTTKFKIEWQAHDENDDTLEYELYFKGTDESNWKLLEKEMTDTNYEWNTETVPDGEYHVKVIAGDWPDNSEDMSLTHERVSQPFMIDNTAPIIGKIEVRAKKGSPDATSFACRVSDNLSPLRSAHYSIDAGDWQAIFPVDGLFDAEEERLEFAAEELEAGEHTIVLKATDYFGNIGTGKTTVTIK
jgi:hypothetical protein